MLARNRLARASWSGLPKRPFNDFINSGETVRFRLPGFINLRPRQSKFLFPFCELQWITVDSVYNLSTPRAVSSRPAAILTQMR